MIRRHWHALSERYTGGDSLMVALDAGWTITGLPYSEDFVRRGRRIRVHHFELEQAGELMKMAVVCNPYVMKLIADLMIREEWLSAELNVVPPDAALA